MGNGGTPDAFGQLQRGVGGEQHRYQGAPRRRLVQRLLQIADHRQLVDPNAGAPKRRQIPLDGGLNGVAGGAELQHRPHRQAEQTPPAAVSAWSRSVRSGSSGRYVACPERPQPLSFSRSTCGAATLLTPFPMSTSWTDKSRRPDLQR